MSPVAIRAAIYARERTTFLLEAKLIAFKRSQPYPCARLYRQNVAFFSSPIQACSRDQIASDLRSVDLMLPAINVEPKISRIIHQTYPHACLNHYLRENVEQLKSWNPRWTHILYDDAAIERFIRENYGQQVLSSYLRINPAYGAARADLFRYLVVYRLGGVYLDIKSRFTRPIDELLRGDEQYIISRWANRPGEARARFGLHPDVAQIEGGELQQWHVIGAAGHPFLRAVIEKVLANIALYRPWKHGVGRIGVLRVTGPIAYTLAITPILHEYPCKILSDERELSMEYSIGGTYNHREALGRHYSELNTPVVRLPARVRWLGPVYSLAKSVKTRLDRS
jgi:hypothetical protein